MSVLIRGGKLVLPDTIREAAIYLKDGIIQAIDPDPVPKATQIIDVQGSYVLPGFIDIHNHGAAGFDFTLGSYQIDKDRFDPDEASWRAGLKRALDHYRFHGCTRVSLTTMAAPLDQLLRCFDYLQRFLSDFPGYRTMVAGINLEGTFLRDPAFAGAQNPDYFYPLEPGILQSLRDAAGNLLNIVNIPPEHGPGALPLLQELVSAGIVVAGGHSGAYADEFNAAIDQGLSLSVHFLNGPSRSFSKSFRGGGAVEAMLQSDRVTLEIIADGYHVHPAYVRDVLARKGADRVAIITDSMFANGLTDLKDFTLFGLKGQLSDSHDYLRVVGKDSLFGSVLSSDTAFRNVLQWLCTDMAGIWHRHHPAMELEDAIILASRLCSANPGKLLELSVRPALPPAGVIAPGYAADLLVADIVQDDSISCCLQQVWTAGEAGV